MRAFLTLLVVIIGLAAGAVYASAFIVHQNEQALVLQFGEPVKEVKSPGLNWKYPFIQTVEYFDKRILDLDTPTVEVTTADQERLLVDAYARYKITNPLLFYQNVRREARLSAVLGPVIESDIRGVLGGSSLQDIVNEKRNSLMRAIATEVNKKGKNYGVEVVDVRLKRADLPEQTLNSVFRRMEQDRVREATELRAQGEAEANRIRATADRDVLVIKAEATKKSDQLRGEGEGARNRIFAEAANKDADFFRFYRSMQAYEQAIKPGETRMLLSPDSEFFRYFQDPLGRQPAPAAGAAKR